MCTYCYETAHYIHPTSKLAKLWYIFDTYRYIEVLIIYVSILAIDTLLGIDTQNNNILLKEWLNFYGTLFTLVTVCIRVASFMYSNQFLTFFSSASSKPWNTNKNILLVKFIYELPNFNQMIWIYSSKFYLKKRLF